MSAPPSPQKIAETVLGGIDWQDDVTGFLECPGKAHHTTPNGAKDCRVKINGVVTVSCFHQCCANEIREANRALRKAFRTGTASAPYRPTAAERKAWRERIAKKEREDRLRQWAISNRGKILSQFAIEPGALHAQSPVKIPESLEEQSRMLLSLFGPNDVVWNGAKESTGRLCFAPCFKSVKEWLAGDHTYASFTCPSTLWPGRYSRCNKNVRHRRFLVVESDKLTHAEHCAIFRFLSQRMKQRAIVDTGGKSLHGWFDFPGTERAEELKIILEALGCDPGMFTASQPCRMPGVLRLNDKGAGFERLQVQELKYFNPTK